MTTGEGPVEAAQELPAPNAICAVCGHRGFDHVFGACSWTRGGMGCPCKAFHPTPDRANEGDSDAGQR